MNSAESFQWPDVAVETLIKLRAEGLSSSQIGAALGISRNAVIGKAARLGLPCAVSVTQYRPTSRRERRPQSLAHGDRRLTQVLSKPRLPVEPLPVVEPAPDHVFLNVGLLDLNRDECRYSLSKEPPFLFCGQPTERGSYCGHCYRIVYAPTRRAA
jgi:GcrA cell cycle regulator